MLHEQRCRLSHRLDSLADRDGQRPIVCIDTQCMKNSGVQIKWLHWSLGSRVSDGIRLSTLGSPARKPIGLCRLGMFCSAFYRWRVAEFAAPLPPKKTTNVFGRRPVRFKCVNRPAMGMSPRGCLFMVSLPVDAGVTTPDTNLDVSEHCWIIRRANRYAQARDIFVVAPVQTLCFCCLLNKLTQFWYQCLHFEGCFVAVHAGFKFIQFGG